MIPERLRNSSGPLGLASKLLGSSVLAQVAVLAATAVTSTGLHPTDFAIYGAVSGATGMSASFNTLAAETRSPVVDEATSEVLNRAGFTALGVINLLTFLVGVAVFASHRQLAWVLVLTAGCAALTGAQQLLTGIVLRRQRQGVLATGRVTQGVTNAVLLLGLWFAHAPGFVVLTVSWLVSMLFGDVVIYLGAARGRLPRRPASRSDWSTLRREVGGQPIANVLAGWVANMPSVLLLALGQSVAAGLWALVSRFLQPLVNTAYITLQPLYYGRAASHVREDDLTALSRLNRRWMAWLGLAGVPVLLGAAFISGVLLPLLGSQWHVGWLLTITGAIYYSSMFVCLPLSQTLQMLGQVGLALVWTIVRFVVCGVPLLLIGVLGGPWALFWWSIGAALTFYWQFWLQRRCLARFVAAGTTRRPRTLASMAREAEEALEAAPDLAVPVSVGPAAPHPVRHVAARAGVPARAVVVGGSSSPAAAGRRRDLATGGVVLGLMAACVAMLWNWRPALWLDEVATLSATQRSWGQLAGMLHHVDLVHAFYYVLMKLWVAVAGTSAFALRLPSALCVGVTIWALHRVALRFVTPTIATAIATVAVCLPRVTWAGSEAREQALAMALAMLATLALLRARAGHGWGRWIGYALLCTLASFASLFTVFLPLAHAVWAWLLRRRHPWRPTAAWAGVSLVPLVPWALLAQTQAAQVAWVGSRSLGALAGQVVIKQYFYGDDKPSGFHHSHAVLGLIGVLALCVVVLVALCAAGWNWLDDAGQRLLALAAVLTVLPLMLLLAATPIVPMYVPRYLTWAAPWLAVPLVLAIRDRRAVAALAAVGCVAGLLLQLPLRQVVDRPANDYRQVAQAVAASGAQSFAITETWLAGVPLAYPHQFQGLVDLSTAVTPARADSLYPALRQPDEVAAAAHGRVMLLMAGSSFHGQSADSWIAALSAHGCRRLDQQIGATVSTSLWECP